MRTFVLTSLSLSLALVASTARAVTSSPRATSTDGRTAKVARIQVRNFHDTFGAPGRPRIIETTPRARAQAMQATILSGNTPSIAVFGAKHTTMTLPTDDLSLRPAYTVYVTPGKKTRFVALIPASGHVGGADAAEQYAATNVYSVVLHRPDGSTQQTLVPSTGFVTRARLNLDLGVGDNVLSIWPRGSGGPPGFPGGREIILRRE